MNVYKRLSEVQKVLKAPKNQFNSFGKYNYRSCEDILEAAKPLCIENGLVLTLSDDVVNVGDKNYVKATATVIDVETGDKHSVEASAREAVTKKGMDDSQITGTASSYARKYALNGLFSIDDTKDADTDHYKQQQGNAPKKQSSSNTGDRKVTTQELINMAQKKGYSEDSLKKKYNVTDVKYIKAATKIEAYDKLAALPDKV